MERAGYLVVWLRAHGTDAEVVALISEDIVGKCALEQELNAQLGAWLGKQIGVTRYGARCRLYHRCNQHDTFHLIFSI